MRLIRKQYTATDLIAIMWFIDDGFTKNKNYYQEEINNTYYPNTKLYLYYGAEFFNSLNTGKPVWAEIIGHLTRNKIENSNEVFSIPDFGTSEEIYDALLKLPSKYWTRLLSKNSKYDLLRKEMFSSGTNLEKAKKRMGY